MSEDAAVLVLEVLISNADKAATFASLVESASQAPGAAS